MKKAPAAKSHSTPAPAAQSTSPRKTPSKGVRDILLALLADGPKTRAQLLKRGGCSPASMHNHLKELRANGIIVADERNRILSMKAQAAAPLPQEELVGEVVEHSSTAGTLVSAVDSHLFKALDALSFRLAPVERAREKLLVLDQLARATPEPVSEILRLVFEDISRLSASKTS